MTYHRQSLGPIAIILSGRPLDEADVRGITRMIDASNVLMSEGGTVRHAVVRSDYQREPTEIRRLAMLLGGPLTHEIVLLCKRNSRLAHRKLAELSCRLSRDYDGLIDLTDLIDGLTNGHVVTGRTADGQPFDYHVVRADDLNAWMNHPQFRMCAAP
jgi:Family of unknown function (DUF6368)